MEDKKSMLDSLPPRMAFWTGVLVTGGVVFALGFIILLTMMFKGVSLTGLDSTAGVKKTANTNVNGTAGGTAVADDTVAAPVAAGSVDLAGLTNVRGEGDITIVEYSDLECPFCKQFHATLQQTLTAYDGQVRWAFKHFPLTSLHSKARREALATECAAEQGQFWEYTDLLIETTNSNDSLPDETLFTMADDLGLDRAKFDDCVESEKFADKVDAEYSEATSLGGQGTPFSVVVDSNGDIIDTIPGALPYESVAQILDQYVQ